MTDSILTFSTIVLALATVILAIFTIMLWHETKKNREYQEYLNEPRLSVIPEGTSIDNTTFEYINLSLKNIGKGPLFNLKLTDVKGIDNILLGGRKLSERRFLQNIKHIRPNQEIKSFVNTIVKLKEIGGESLEVSMFFEYEDSKHKKYKARFDIDFLEPLGIMRVIIPTQEMIEEANKQNNSKKEN